MLDEKTKDKIKETLTKGDDFKSNNLEEIEYAISLYISNYNDIQKDSINMWYFYANSVQKFPKLLLKLNSHLDEEHLRRILTRIEFKEISNIEECKEALRQIKPIELNCSSFISNLEDVDLIIKFKSHVGIDKLHLDFDRLYPLYSGGWFDSEGEKIFKNFTIKQQQKLLLQSLKIENSISYFEDLINENNMSDEILSKIENKYVESSNNKHYYEKYVMARILQKFKNRISDHTKFHLIKNNPSYIKDLPEHLIEKFAKEVKSSIALSRLLSHPKISKYKNALDKAFKSWMRCKLKITLDKPVEIPDEIVKRLSIKQVKALLEKIEYDTKIKLNTDILKTKILQGIAGGVIEKDDDYKLHILEKNNLLDYVELIVGSIKDLNEDGNYIKVCSKILDVDNDYKEVKLLLLNIVKNILETNINEAIEKFEESKPIIENYLKNKGLI